MGRICNYAKSSIGRKQVMALTGLGLSLFVLIHMAGNLLILVGPETYNNYGNTMVNNPLIYEIEIGLLAIFLLHIICAISLTVENRRARPVRYAASPKGSRGGISFAAKSLIYTGLLVFVFVVLHLITFKYGEHYLVDYQGKQIRDLFRLILEVFHSPAYVAWYIFSMLVLGLHLSHGFASTFQSMGWNKATVHPCIRRSGCIFAAIITLGFSVVPLYIFFKG